MNEIRCVILVEVLGETTVPLLLCPPQIHRVLAWVVGEIGAVYCELRTKRTQCTGKVQYRVFYMLKQLVRPATMLVRLNT
jgi:hypothetical protein